MVAKPVHGSLVPAKNKMTVQVYSDLDGGMAHLLLNVDRAFPLLKKQGLKDMAEVMEAYLP
jgi:hypothetical protein